MDIELPLFPLNAVLFPGSRLELRIFEQRYLDLIRDSMRQGTGFGICLLLQALEGQTPTEPARIGTEARIIDFGTLPDGLLGITVQGGRRFAANDLSYRPNGLLRARVQYWPAEISEPVAAEYALLVTILNRLADNEDGELAAADKACFDDAAWVSYRLADRLPIPLEERQQILELTDATARLRQLTLWLPRFVHE